MADYRIGDALIRRTSTNVITDYGTGLVAAMANDDPEDRARAASLGYDDVCGMTRDHDVLHALIADARGWPHSPTLWALAHQQPSPDCADDEERLCLLVQRLLNVGLDAVLEDYRCG